MLVVIANNVPPAVRGRMKLWFIEYKPNVFVSGVKDHLAKKIVKYLHKNCPLESGLVIFNSIKQAPGYEINGLGDYNKKLVSVSGLQLIMENNIIPSAK
jgi:CRISPR-associated protein Cas2